MKNYLRIFTLLAVLFGGAAASSAQTDSIVGGYNMADLTAPQIVSAANFAVKTQAKKQRAKIKLKSIRRAEQQVVAGMNYSICLAVETRERGKKTFVPQTVQAVVFLNLKQKYELTSWTIAACAEETPTETTVK